MGGQLIKMDEITPLGLFCLLAVLGADSLEGVALCFQFIVQCMVDYLASLVYTMLEDVNKSLPYVE
jgi:hypothetical protein